MVARLRHADAAGLLAVAVALFVLLPGIGWGLPTARDGDSTFPWGFDEQAPLPPLVEAQAKFCRPSKPGAYVPYPLFHYVVLTASYLPYLAYEYATGAFRPTQAFPYGMADPAATCGALLLIARGVTVVMAGGCVWFVYRIARSIGVPRWPAAGAGAAVALMPTFVYYGRTSNFDIPYVFWTVAAFHAAAGFLFAGQHGVWPCVRFGAFAALAVATKDQAYGFLIALPPLMLLILWYGPYGGLPARARVSATLRHRPLWMGLVASVFAYTLANNLLFGWDGFRAHVRQTLDMSTIERKWSSDAAGQFGLLLDVLLQLAWNVGPLALLAVLGASRLLRERRGMVLAFLLAPIVAHQILVLGKIGYTYPRFVLLPAMLTLLLASCSFRPGPTLAFVAARTAIAAVGFAYLCLAAGDVTRAQWADARYGAEDFLAAETEPGQTAALIGRFTRLAPRLPDGVALKLVPPGHGAAEKVADLAPDFVIDLDMSEGRNEERYDFGASYRRVLDRSTPSVLVHRFVRCLAPHVVVYRREPLP